MGIWLASRPVTFLVRSAVASILVLLLLSALHVSGGMAQDASVPSDNQPGEETVESAGLAENPGCGALMTSAPSVVDPRVAERWSHTERGWLLEAADVPADDTQADCGATTSTEDDLAPRCLSAGECRHPH